MDRPPSTANLGIHHGDVITAPITRRASPSDESFDEQQWELEAEFELELDELDLELDELELRAWWLTRSSSPASAGAGRPAIPSATKTMRRHRRFKQAGIWTPASQGACRHREPRCCAKYPQFLPWPRPGLWCLVHSRCKRNRPLINGSQRTIFLLLLHGSVNPRLASQWLWVEQLGCLSSHAVLLASKSRVSLLGQARVNRARRDAGTIRVRTIKFCPSRAVRVGTHKIPNLCRVT